MQKIGIELKILHYLDSFSLPSETFIYDLINDLEKIDILDNELLIHNRFLEEQRAYNKIKQISNQVSFLYKIYYKLFKPFYIRNHIYVSKYIKEQSPDIIHAHFGINGIKIARLLWDYKINIPLIISFHGMDVNMLPIKYPKYKELLYKLNQENIYFIVPSLFLKEKLSFYIKDSSKITIIPNKANQIFFDNGFVREYTQENLQILHIGRFEEVKGQIYLLQAINNLIKESYKIRLTIIGYGTLQKELEEYIDNQNLKNSVKIIEKIEHNNIPSIMKEHQLYIQPSIKAQNEEEESFSVSTIEAMANGLPCIVSQIGGLKETIDENCGIFVRQKNEIELANAIKRYILEKDLIIVHSQNAIKRSKKLFATDTIIEKYNTKYKAIL